MDRDINEQDEINANVKIENEAAGNHLNNAFNIINDQLLLNNVHLGKTEKVIDLLQSGASVEAENAGQIIDDPAGFMTPLQVAASNGYVDIVQILLDHGANVYAKNIRLDTALHMAARNGHSDCLKVLLKVGADAFASVGMNTKAEAFDKLGATALNIAVINNHIKCVVELLEYGINIDAYDENGQSFREVLAEHAIYECVPTTVHFTTSSETASNTNNFISDDPNLSFLLMKRINQCAKKLIFIGSVENNIKCNGISQLPVVPTTGCENVDLQIFKLFILESYFIDHHIPRGLTTLRHIGSKYYNSKIAAILITCFSDIVIKDELKNLYMNLIEYLLFISDRFEVLKYVAKCILWIPRLNSLTILPIANKLPVKNCYDEIVEDFVLPPNVTFALKRDETSLNVEIHDRKTEFNESLLMWKDITNGIPKYGLYPLTQSLINLINERISDEIHQLQVLIAGNDDIYNLNYLPKCNYYLELLRLRKYIWYEKIAFNPPTLSECCRYSLLKGMGPLKVKNIEKLHLPDNLKSYLLFQ